jgi:hypothetical protein
MLLRQFDLLERRRATAERGRRPVLGADGQALLEAVLVHLRLLDDFLGSPKQCERRESSARNDVFARHWVPSWRPNRFLTGKQRKRINAQLMHLAWRRLDSGWNIRPEEVPDMVRGCCRRLNEFFAQVEALDRDRLRAFRDAPRRVREYLENEAARLWAR